MANDYEQRLAGWKSKHGITGSHIEPYSPDELRMVDEDKNNTGTGYCCECGDEFRVCDMTLITRRMDPYIQTDESGDDYIPENERMRMCVECQKVRREEDTWYD